MPMHTNKSDNKTNLPAAGRVEIGLYCLCNRYYMPSLALNFEFKGTKFVSFVTYAFLKFIHIKKIVVMANSFL